MLKDLNSWYNSGQLLEAQVLGLLGSGQLLGLPGPDPIDTQHPREGLWYWGVGSKLRRYVFLFWVRELLIVERQEVPAQPALPPEELQV